MEKEQEGEEQEQMQEEEEGKGGARGPCHLAASSITRVPCMLFLLGPCLMSPSSFEACFRIAAVAFPTDFPAPDTCICADPKQRR